MSAINGLYYMDVESTQIEHGDKLMEALKHYPSDSRQTWHSENIFLGCHAQWITPESVGETMPRYNAGMRLAITADAIIDNRQELFDRLQVEPTLRNNMPDSELIVLAYLKWGEEAPKYLIGDFVFMIWDLRKKLLFGARDFSGARTLYFYRDPKRFAFCTTIEPLFQLPYLTKNINEQWFADFLVIPGMVDTVDASSTAYHNIEQLPPSHSITVQGGKVKLSRYYKMSFGEQLKLKTNEEYEEALRDVFQQAVTARIRSCGEVGAQLSGGMDSGTVVSFAAKALSKEHKRLHTFSYIPEDDFQDWTPGVYLSDERPYISSTVDYVGNITDHYLNFGGKGPFSDLEDSLNLMEMPYKFFSNVFWLKGIYENAHRRGVKVVLSGARGNHSISWGSHSLNFDYYVSLFKKLRWIRLNKELSSYCQYNAAGKSNLLPLIVKKAFSPLKQSNSAAASQGVSSSRQLINASFAQKTNIFERLKDYGIDVTKEKKSPNEFRKRHFEQLYIWNKNGMAATKLSLRYSLWDRDPTNDLRVIRFCMAVPDEQYVNNGLERSLIRRATKNLLPDKVRLNQQVRGIQGADVIHRMTSSWKAFIEEINQLTLDSRLAGMLNMDAIKQAISKVGHSPSPEMVFTEEFIMLTRSLTIYRFIKKMH